MSGSSFLPESFGGRTTDTNTDFRRRIVLLKNPLFVMPGDWHLLGPLEWTRYVNKEVKVTAGKDVERCGWLLTVDPVSAR